jgi:type IV pilus assembly protein PilA
MGRVRHRVAREEGFTLIELLIVIAIVGILLAIAVPSYLRFEQRANQKAANSDVRAAMPAAETFFVDNGSYSGMDVGALRAIDSGVDLGTVVVSTTTAAGRTAGDTYCMEKSVGGAVARVVRGNAALAGESGGLGSVKEGVACPAAAAL